MRMCQISDKTWIFSKEICKDHMQHRHFPQYLASMYNVFFISTSKGLQVLCSAARQIIAMQYAQAALGGPGRERSYLGYS